MNFIGVSEKKLPEIVRPGTLIGKISRELSGEIGLKPDTKVVIGAMDHVCGAIGAGNISRGIATETTGSAFAMVITTGEPVFNFEYKLPCITPWYSRIIWTFTIQLYRRYGLKMV